MTIVQVREDPENYVEGETPPIYMITTSNNVRMYKVNYNHGSNELVEEANIDIVINIADPLRKENVDAKITMTPEHIDVGRQHLVVMSPVDCAANVIKLAADAPVTTDD